MWLWFSILSNIILLTSVRTENKLTVAFTEQKPFVILNQNGTPSGLDVLIVQNFAKHFNFELKFLPINQSLSSIFSDGRHLEDSSFQQILKYDQFFSNKKTSTAYKYLGKILGTLIFSLVS